MEHDPIAAPATALGKAALAVIRTSGAGTIGKIATLARRSEAVSAAAGYTMVHTELFDPSSGETLDDVVLALFRPPRSYTGEEMVEISCHGSPAGVARILSALESAGFRPADPGEFTLRAFVNGKVDLTRAEAVHEVVTAQTDRAHEMALDRLAGTVEREINAIKALLVTIMASIAVQLDYAEEDTGDVPFPLETVRDARARLSALASTYRTGRIYQEGARIALAGRPNAGKSSLFNALLRQDRSIVSETPGTTRDYIESVADIRGIPVRIFDTAGLREASEAIEGEGIARTTRVVAGADVVLYLVDGSAGVNREDEAWLRDAPEATVRVWTKADLNVPPPPEGFLSVSARTFLGVDALLDDVARRVLPGVVSDGAVVIDSRRQKDLIDRAVAALDEVVPAVEASIPVDAVSLDVQEAIRALGEITGEVTSADILDAVFGSFCLGK